MKLRINIDLLPHSQIETEKSAIIVIPILGLILVVLIVGYFTYSAFHLNSQATQLDENIIENNGLILNLEETLANKTTGITEFNYSDKYLNVDGFINTLYKDTIELKSSLYYLLPENANVESYAYTNSGDLNVAITFPSKGDAAIYLNRLLQAEFVETAFVTTINSDTEEISYTSQYVVKLKTLVGEAL